MANKFLKTKSIMIVVVLCVACFTALNFAIKYGIQHFRLAPENSIVSEERLTKDINTILLFYGLKKSHSDLVIDTSHPNYKNHIKEPEIKEKGIFIDATPILFDSGRKYTEVETYMEIWLYVMEHNFDFEIDGIVYYFTSHSLDSILAPITPNELYMTREEFLSFYNNLDIDKLSHSKKVKELAMSYVKKNNYKRKSGHVQVDL